MIQTAHNIIISCLSADGDQSALIRQRTSGLIGRRGVGLLEDLRMPCSIRDSFGMEIAQGDYVEYVDNVLLIGNS